MKMSKVMHSVQFTITIDELPSNLFCTMANLWRSLSNCLIHWRCLRLLRQCGRGTDFSYGPWADRQRDSLFRFFFPTSYEPQKVTAAGPARPATPPPGARHPRQHTLRRHHGCPVHQEPGTDGDNSRYPENYSAGVCWIWNRYAAGRWWAVQGPRIVWRLGWGVENSVSKYLVRGKNALLKKCTMWKTKSETD